MHILRGCSILFCSHLLVNQKALTMSIRDGVEHREVILEDAKQVCKVVGASNGDSCSDEHCICGLRPPWSYCEFE